jgi:predicted nuclease with RNAse H fold
MVTVVGIDVGGPRKGYHAVALTGNSLQTTASADPAKIRAWCLAHGAAVIGIDAPCSWRDNDGARACERELARNGMSSFSTPSREKAGHPFYSWMGMGFRLYEALACDFPLFDGIPSRPSQKLAFETFPHAVCCALAGCVVAARPKSAGRRQALRTAGIDDGQLKNIDYVDAALCAITARHLVNGRIRLFGEKPTGFIVTPVWTPRGS